MEKILAILTAFIVLLLPTIGIHEYNSRRPTLETTFFWPWLILSRYQPQNPDFNTDMYNFVLPPYSLIIFIPFILILFQTRKQFKLEGPKERVAGIIALLAILQMVMVWIVYQPTITGSLNDRTMIYLPQLLILGLQGGFGAKWYYEKVNSILKTPQKPSRPAKNQDNEADN